MQFCIAKFLCSFHIEYCTNYLKSIKFLNKIAVLSEKNVINFECCMFYFYSIPDIGTEIVIIPLSSGSSSVTPYGIDSSIHSTGVVSKPKLVETDRNYKKKNKINYHIVCSKQINKNL